MAAARNVLIIFALAAAVYFLPGGGDTAALVSGILVTLITVIFVYFGVRFYRENRIDIYSLGDRGRAMLYGGLAALVLALAATGRWLDTSAGIIAWAALIGFGIYALVAVYRQYREYGG